MKNMSFESCRWKKTFEAGHQAKYPNGRVKQCDGACCTYFLSRLLHLHENRKLLGIPPTCQNACIHAAKSDQIPLDLKLEIVAKVDPTPVIQMLDIHEIVNRERIRRAVTNPDIKPLHITRRHVLRIRRLKALDQPRALGQRIAKRDYAIQPRGARTASHAGCVAAGIHPDAVPALAVLDRLAEGFFKQQARLVPAALDVCDFDARGGGKEAPPAEGLGHGDEHAVAPGHVFAHADGDVGVGGGGWGGEVRWVGRGEDGVAVHVAGHDDLGG